MKKSTTFRPAEMKPVRLVSRSLRVESHLDNDREAHELLDLINAEFQSDPMSVQCFDMKIVERVKLCVARRKAGPLL